MPKKTTNEQTKAVDEESGGRGMVSKSAVKRYLRDNHELRTAGDLAELLEGKVWGLLDQAASRARANSRQTVQPADL